METLEDIHRAVSAWPADWREDWQETVEWYEETEGYSSEAAVRQAWALLSPLLRGDGPTSPAAAP